jgi:hypothetical protein
MFDVVTTAVTLCFPVTWYVPCRVNWKIMIRNTSKGATAGRKENYFDTDFVSS